MNMKNVFLVLSLATLTACGFGRTSDPAKFYALSVPSVTQVRGPEKSVNVGIDNVSVPQSVDRPQIVVKYKDSNMVDVSEFNRWIEGLNTALPVAVAENINAYAKNINARPVRNSTQVSHAKYIVTIDFVRFDTEIDGKINVSAWWTISNNRGDILVQKKTNMLTGTPTSDSDTPDYDAIVATQSELVAKLSYKIADTISGLK